MNFLKETIAAIEEAGQTPREIIFIGCYDGRRCTWAEFCRLADVQYDNGYGGQNIEPELIVIFANGGRLDRSEYDGSEGWEYTPPFKFPEKPRPLMTVYNRHY